MKLLDNDKYISLLNEMIPQFYDWDDLSGKSVFISGATGMIGSFLIDTLMERNLHVPAEKRCTILATSRSLETAKRRFTPWLTADEFFFFPHDITEPIDAAALPRLPDYLIHAASNTHPIQYASEPINTILANVLGTRNILDLAVQSGKSRVLLLSSVEIYGENRGDTDYFDEKYCGVIDCNTLRAGYPEGKRASESLCQAYIRQCGVDVTILRLPRSYGPTMRMTDSKAIAQFIKKGVAGEDIVLKSQGNQLYSYAHVADAVTGILWTLLRGETGQAYNLGDRSSDITLRDLAEIIAGYAGTKVVFELPEEKERIGYSTATTALMDAEKLKKLGWIPAYDICRGVQETIDILREQNGRIVEVGGGNIFRQ